MPVPDEHEHFVRLKVWAEVRGLSVQTSTGTQRDPENVVALSTAGGVELLSRRSLDSIDTAAMYVLHTVDLLTKDPSRNV